LSFVFSFYIESVESGDQMLRVRIFTLLETSILLRGVIRHKINKISL